MTLEFWLPLLAMSCSLVPGLIIFALDDEQHTARTVLNMAGATLKLVFIAIMFQGAFRGVSYESRLPFLPGLDFVLRVDPISLLFATLSAGLWFVTTIYAIGYLEGSPHRSRFFGFFSLCVTATMGVALAGNLITFFIFYEALTLATYPLVTHRGTPVAMAGGRTYLAYTLGGGAILLVGVAWLHALAGPVELAPGGVLTALAETHPGELTAIFGLLIAGLGVKAALFPLHGWLPRAMVAPAPVSALLHAVAVVKAGAYGIVRVVYDLYGLDLATNLGVLTPLAAMAAVTIVYGSVRALAQTDLKRRLAYSTVSQVSYIILGVALVGQFSTIGGLAHLMHQGLMKITLFFCAGVMAETLGIHKIAELAGVGRRLPLTTAAFTVAAFGMMGLPPTAGFISKWYLGLGAVESGTYWSIGVLALSGILNAAYFLPILHLAWFRGPDPSWKTEAHAGPEASRALLWPALATGVASLLAGLFAGSDLSPLHLAELVTAGLYGR